MTREPVDPEIFRQIAREYARSAKDVPSALGVYLMCRRSSALILTVIGGEPRDRLVRDHLFSRQSAIRARNPELSLDFTTVNPLEWPDEVRVEVVPADSERIWRRSEGKVAE